MARTDDRELQGSVAVGKLGDNEHLVVVLGG
jgi:hypothetical protein